MAAPTATITANFPDAVPGTAPNKISALRQEIALMWSVVFTGNLGAFQVRVGGTSNRLTGKIVASRGAVCGVTRLREFNYDGTNYPRPMQRATSPFSQGSPGIAFYDMYLYAAPLGEGDYRLSVEAANDDGWST